MDTKDEIQAATATINAIQDGACDEHFDLVYGAIKERKSILASRNVVGVRTGDTVTFSNSIRPKYLIGMTATVVKRNPKSVVVTCPDDPAYGRFQNARNVRCPNSLIAGA